MEEKTRITRDKIEHLKKEYGAVFYIELAIASIFALIAFIFVPGGFIITGIILAVVIPKIVRNSKSGPMQIYFIERPVTNKFVGNEKDTDGEYSDHFYLTFDDKNCLVRQERFAQAVIGDMFYVMYDSADGHPIDCYEVSAYDLEPGLELRQLQ